ncbi:MAG: GTPase HflX [Gammaproteobacteria bacterium]|nr:GTPase HflX [Gammaproteobacteria bacterium]
MFEHERHRGGERAVLVHVEFSNDKNFADALSEFSDLAVSAGVLIIEEVIAKRHAPDAKFYVGSGKAQEIAELIQSQNVDIALFNQDLSPSQERNLETEFKCRVLDRTGLILDIFAQRARSHEGKLQVELAQLKHLSTRLVRGWSHLERQKGGIGLRGPGETQLETDRRLLAKRIKQIERRLEKVHKQREQGRQARRKVPIPTVSLVGYTNTGKSSLFNGLTKADVFTADQLFATLDATLRRLPLNDQMEVILADTVGFIRDLPHDLVAAFRSTLQESREANMLLHVVDAADPDRQEKMLNVNEVLKEIAADSVEQLEVYNKIDLLEQDARIDRNAEGQATRVWLSAKSGAGLDLLLQVLAERFEQERTQGWLKLSSQEGQIRAALFELSAVKDEQYDDDGCWILEISLAQVDYQRFCAQYSFDGTRLSIKSPVAGAAKATYNAPA